MKLHSLVFVSLALLSLASATIPQATAVVYPSNLTVIITNAGYRSVRITMGICGSGNFVLEGWVPSWEINCKFEEWQWFTLKGGESTMFKYNLPIGKYVVNVAWPSVVGPGVEELASAFEARETGTVYSRAFVLTRNFTIEVLVA